MATQDAKQAVTRDVMFVPRMVEALAAYHSLKQLCRQTPELLPTITADLNGFAERARIPVGDLIATLSRIGLELDRERLLATISTDKIGTV